MSTSVAPSIVRPAAVDLLPSLPPGGSPLRRLLFWAGHTGYWGMVFAANLLLVEVFDIADPVGFVGLEIALCFLATAAMRSLSQRGILLVRLGISQVGLIAGGLVLSVALIAVVLLAARPAFGLPVASRGEFIARAAMTFAMLATWCGFYFGYHLVRAQSTVENRALLAEAAALRNEISMLHAQISPHFLFNALNTIIGCRHDPEAIETVTQSLSNYLEFLLRPAAPLEPLSRELDALEEYLTVQGMRFGDALETRIECDRDVRRVAVLPVLVQPLVENALKYGGRTSPKPLSIRVVARRDGDWATIEVANTGSWVPPDDTASTGTGLFSLERRLQLLVGPLATVRCGAQDGWVRVQIRLPVVDATRTCEEMAG